MYELRKRHPSVAISERAPPYAGLFFAYVLISIYTHLNECDSLERHFVAVLALCEFYPKLSFFGSIDVILDKVKG